MNLIAIIIVAILSAILIAFLILRNRKDRQKFEQELKNDYPRPRDKTGDIDIDTITKDVH